VGSPMQHVVFILFAVSYLAIFVSIPNNLLVAWAYSVVRKIYIFENAMSTARGKQTCSENRTNLDEQALFNIHGIRICFQIRRLGYK
jgi:hypothetical protein